MAPPSPTRRRHHLAASALLVVTAAVTAGCSSGGSGPAPEPAPSTGPSAPARVTAPPSPSPTAPADLAGQRAIAAYVGLWQAIAEASHTSNWRSPDLARYASGSALQVASGGLYADHYNGLVSRGAPVLHPKVISVSPAQAPTTVMVFDCADSATWLRYRTAGPSFTDDPGGRRAVTSEVRLHQDGSWKVTRYAVDPVGSC